MCTIVICMGCGIEISSARALECYQEYPDGMMLCEICQYECETHEYGLGEEKNV